MVHPQSASYEGRWLLVPELSVYENGTPPDSGTYEIKVENGQVSFSIDWTLAGKAHSLAFHGPADGKPHPLTEDADTQVVYTHIDSQTLESRVLSAGQEKAFALRRVSHDNRLMVVSQVTGAATDCLTRSFQIYRRLAQ